MAEDAEVRGTLTKVGEETVEVYKLELDLDDASREKLKADPRAVIQGFLESQGHTVNGLLVADLQGFDDDWPAGWLHIPSGEYRSRWFPILL
ncbi:hypothetical protein BN159_1380 [Streptomyces davaonensis JCM 4913]|uniref:Uncharacterized protein n=1 Tax=Streptomyces davaonensis (strain DSM 101723 / JCM 4913 / KCC S-0913 / 768) TaxID=1214101 RepID=K4QZF3_STRDJ|nr:hypothetical protein [Streptomyces davaonensis]CCK25759.1 hypothetical protein BN159_1380 [Streptomyces davaonensis JCM 4913]